MVNSGGLRIDQPERFWEPSVLIIVKSPTLPVASVLPAIGEALASHPGTAR
jgi:hypothetical protein